MASMWKSLLRTVTLGTVVAGLCAQGCAVDAAPTGVRRATKYDGGPTVVFDLARRPQPELPLPNDVATWPDPTSRTGRRINASMVAGTIVERDARERFSRLEGWGVYAPLSIPFDKPLDTEDIKRRHANDDYDFKDDAVYLVNLKTGVPVPLDLGAGNFPVTLRSLDRYWANDEHRTESNLWMETREEDTNGNGVLDPGEDTDWDGVLDHPNFPGGVRPPNGVDGLLTFYESETNSLILRPLIPLDEMTEYAVVVTDRLHGADAKKTPVQSPFEYIHHPAQKGSTERLASMMEAKPQYYGFAAAPLDHVQFVFTFTTQATMTDLFALRDGVYGQGKLGWMAEEFPPQFTMLRAVGKVEPGDPDPTGWDTCTDDSNVCKACKQQVAGTKTLYIAKYTDSMRDTLKDVVDQVFGIHGPAGKRLLQSFDNVAYMAIGVMKVPWLLGDIKDVDPKASIVMDPNTGEIPHSADEVPFFIIVPKTTDKHKPPFPVSFYGHGYTGNATEGLAFAGELARHGVATVSMNAPGHGLELSEGDKTLAKALFGGGCLTPFALAFQKSRVRDLNGDGEVKDESGRDFWTPYPFHTRDVVRQAVMEQSMMLRVLRSFDGKTTFDWDGDGKPDLAGDFDGDGKIDLGGPDVQYYAWGESLGGILYGVHGGVDSYLTAAAPTAGGGSLTDLGARSFQGGVTEQLLRLIGPLVVNVPAEARFDHKKDINGKEIRNPDGSAIFADVQTRTACKQGEQSLRYVIVDLNKAVEVEFACVPSTELAEGYDVLVHNTTNDEVRCGGVTFANADYAGGAVSEKIPASPGFRVGFPASTGDGVAIAVYKPAPGKKQALLNYGRTCEVDPAATLVRTIESFGGFGTVCDEKDPESKCVAFQTQRHPIGSPLVSLSDGLGLKRQSADFRRFWQLIQVAWDGTDAVTVAPYYYLKPRLDPYGKPAGKTALLQIGTAGDMNVPVNGDIAIGRIAGVVPFLRPSNVAAADYPDYVAPEKLMEKWGGVTPNTVLLQNHVIEGIARLGRHPAGPACANNFDPTADPECKGNAALDAATCRNALFDSENLSDGLIPFAPQTLKEPMRLARFAAPATGADIATVWAPRIDLPKALAPSKQLGALLVAYIEPGGVHGFDPPDPCKKWDDGMYLLNVIGRFFRSGGQDLWYLSHPDPKDNQCAAVTDPKSDKACKFDD